MKLWSLILAAGCLAAGCALPTDATAGRAAELGDGSDPPGESAELDDTEERSDAMGSAVPHLRQPRLDRGFVPHGQCRMFCDAGLLGCRLLCPRGHSPRQRCGPNVCIEGEYCCNESCGTCSLIGGSCAQEACEPGL